MICRKKYRKRGGNGFGRKCMVEFRRINRNPHDDLLVFLSCLPRNIHRPKWCYLVVFFLHSMTFCYVIYRWGNAGAGTLITVAGCILACYFLFTTDQIQMFYSCVYVTVLILCQGIVIYGLGSTYARLGLFITYREANVMILLKIVAEIFGDKMFRVDFPKNEERAV